MISISRGHGYYAHVICSKTYESRIRDKRFPTCKGAVVTVTRIGRSMCLLDLDLGANFAPELLHGLYQGFYHGAHATLTGQNLRSDTTHLKRAIKVHTTHRRKV